ncbi:MAG: glycoside hydrolase family 3 N-terminal domain-containing protein [Candidatus Promineifilaceae bacterium]|nr:glycoside hydrolase family 3 N-terminal domain-containing protein [Candidatus Promineifilaceae bacterium]
MSVAERVGQLFLVTFQGDRVEQHDVIADLILNYEIGGVVLLAGNDNITGRGAATPEDFPLQVAQLTNQMQAVALLGESAFITTTQEARSTLPLPAPAESDSAIPLFVATQQEGNGVAFSQIHTGLTELPSPMAIGATWQPPLARDVGAIVGQEMAALGVNMLLGPSLDVLAEPGPEAGNDLSVRSFGGNPFWVGQMGQAYTSGVHSGSEGRVAVIPRHFPGRGSSDRAPGEEVATVRRSLAQLKELELTPFFAVTGGAAAQTTQADGLLTAHTRYQGVQGNIQTTTPPLSFDPIALQQLLTMAGFGDWRDSGGVLVSDALGVAAVQRFYDSTGQEFPHRRIAKDALLAGNDLLFLDDFAQRTDSLDAQLLNIRDTVTWFQEKYHTDPSFRQRVDQAVLYILQLKLALYEGDFSPENVLVDPAATGELVGQSRAVVHNVAQQAITLLAPSPAEVSERLPRPPGPEEQIVIFTDVRSVTQCRYCPSVPYIERTSLEEHILELYGPEASNQTAFEQIKSYTYGQLEQFLAAGPGRLLPPTPIPTPTPPQDGAPSLDDDAVAAVPGSISPVAYQIQTALDEADWVIFAMLDVTPAVGNSDALQRFLAERDDIVRNKRVVVFAYDAPYFLDMTEVSKLAAYYGVYSTAAPFIDASVRALFQETSLPGASPVDVPSVGYDLEQIMQPDPEQVIELFVVDGGELRSPSGEEPMELVVGDTLRLQTGTIHDRNGNPVPDGTIVQFIRQDRLEGFHSVIAEQETTNGVATLDYVLEARPGQFRITVEAGEATTSHQLDIAVEENVRVAAVTPTPAPTPTATPSPTPTSTATPTTTPIPPTPTSTTVIAVEPQEPQLSISLLDFRLLVGVFGGLALTMSAGWAITRADGPDALGRRVRLIVWAIIAALVAYNYYLLGLPGAELLTPYQRWAGLFTTAAGGLVALLLFWGITNLDPPGSLRSD